MGNNIDLSQVKWDAPTSGGTATANPPSGQQTQPQPTNSGIDLSQVKWDAPSLNSPAQPQGKPFYDAMGASLTPQEKIKHPIVAGLEQTAQDVGTLGEKAFNGLTFGTYERGLKANNIQPPNFDNTAPENKNALNMFGDVASLGSGNKALGTIGNKVIAPIAKAVPQGLKQSSYALMQSIVNQLPKEFKYGANAGRAMVKEKLQGDASDIQEQSAAKIKEIGATGDKLASSSNKPVNNSNAIRIIDDKIADLQENAPRYSESSINRLQNAKKDLLGIVEDNKGNVTNEGIDTSKMTPQETLDFKRKFDYQTQWKGTASDDTTVNSTLQQARRAVKDNLNEAVPGMKEWNQRYADLAAANQAAARKVTYDQAGSSLKNMISGVIRGTIGITTLGAAIHGNGELAGEILAGWGAKEIAGNPMVKSKVAQMLYGLSEADKSDIFKVVPWAKNLLNGMRQQPAPRGTPVDAELVDNRPQGLPFQPKVGLNRALPRNVGTADASVQPMGGYVPKGLPEPLGPTVRVGVNPPGTALPSPSTVGRSPIPMRGYVPPGQPESPMVNTSPPKYGTDDANLLYGQMKAKENIPLHPPRDVSDAKSVIYAKNTPEVLAKNMGIKPDQVDHIHDIKGMLESSEKGTNSGVSYKGGKQGESFHWGTSSNVPEFLKGKYTTTELSKMLDDKLNGDKVTPGQSIVIKKLLKHYFPES